MLWAIAVAPCGATRYPTQDAVPFEDARLRPRRVRRQPQLREARPVARSGDEWLVGSDTCDGGNTMPAPTDWKWTRQEWGVENRYGW